MVAARVLAAAPMHAGRVCLPACRQMQAQLEQFTGLQDNPERALRIASSMGCESLEELMLAGVGFQADSKGRLVFTPDLHMLMALYKCVPALQLLCASRRLPAPASFNATHSVNRPATCCRSTRCLATRPQLMHPTLP